MSIKPLSSMTLSLKTVFAFFFAVFLAGTLIAEDIVLNPEHPDRYVVVKGDTLWDISELFLRDPWLWPEIWYVNPQVTNPHLIYPGDILTLIYIDGKPQLRLQRGYPTVKLSPHARVESLDLAIPTIPMDVIRPFLTRPLVVDKNELDQAPYVVESADEHIVTGAGDRVYVRGIEGEEEPLWDIFRPGGPYIDPDTNEILGYEALYVGTSATQRFGDPATLLLTETNREVRIGDRLRPAEPLDPITHFLPHSPPPGTEGRIISVIDGVSQIGQFDIVVINRGTNAGMELGHVMKIFQAGKLIKDTVGGGKVQLPDEQAGLLMVFRTFDRVSFCLVMKATRAIHIHDYVRTP